MMLKKRNKWGLIMMPNIQPRVLGFELYFIYYLMIFYHIFGKKKSIF